jgi:ABC-2 type transport system ATP-binding protein
MIEVSDLWKDFAGALALRALSFSVQRGEVVGLLGQNGAGKTTTMRILTGSLVPSRGRVFVAGYDLDTHEREARRSVGYLPESVPLHPELRVSEFLAYRADLKSLRAPRAALSRALEQAGLTERKGQVIATLSKGYRQRVGLADALLGDPPLLILDEPTEGLDPTQITLTRELVRALSRERTVLLSTHILSEVEQLCSRALLLHRGRLVADLARDDAGGWNSEKGAPLRLHLRVVSPPETLAETLGALSGVAAVEGQGERFTLTAAPGQDPSDAIVQCAASLGLGLRELRPAARGLEEAFLAATAREALPGEA